MQAGLVNASQLLASFLGSEQEKIGQSISESEFAGELGKLLPSDTAEANPDPSAPANTANTTPDETPAAAAKTAASGAASFSPRSSCRKCISSAGAKARLNDLKTQAKCEKDLVVANPLLLDSILANLHYPAETIKACKALQNKRGWIALKDIKTLLENRPQQDGTSSPGQITAQQVQELVGAIVSRDSQAGQGNVKPVSGNVSSSIRTKTEGFYTADEFRELIEKVLQNASRSAAEQQNPAGATETSDGNGLKTSSEGGNLAGQAVVAPRSGQSEMLASSVLPSFVSEDSEGGAWKKRSTVSGPKNTSASPQQIENEISSPNREEVSSGKSPVSTAAAKITGLTADSAPNRAQAFERAATGTGQPGSGGPADSAAAASEKTPSLAVSQAAGRSGASGPNSSPGALASVLEAFEAKLVSRDGIPSNSEDARLPGSRPEWTPSQAQNLAPAAKNLERQAAGDPKVCESTDFPAMADSFGADSVEKVPAQNHAEEALTHHDPNQTADADSDGSDPAAAKRRGAREDFSLRQTDSLPDGTEESKTNLRGQRSPAAASIADGNAEEPAVADQTLEADLPQRGQAIPEAGDDPARRAWRQTGPGAGYGNEPSGAREKHLAPLSAQTAQAASSDRTPDPRPDTGEMPSTTASLNRLGGLEEQSGSGDDAQSFPARDATATAPSRPDQLRTAVHADGRNQAEEKAQSQGSETAADATEMGKRPGTDSAAENPFLQTAAPRVRQGLAATQTEGMSGDSLSCYDPNRSAQVAQAYRDQSQIAGGRQLVLEMEPEQLGKISIKVGTKKDEVSARIVTDNEAARQSLLKNTPELRQDLGNQGLVLGKFLVDVNREKTGGREWEKPEGKSAPAATTKEAAPQARSSFRQMDTPLSNISLFA